MAASDAAMKAEQLSYHRRLRRVEHHLVPLSRCPTSAPQVVSNTTSRRISSFLTDLHRHIVLSPAVQSALLSRFPVIALESTIITHGMKYPENYHTALRVQQVASSLGVTPATIAVLSGRIHVGLTDEQIEQLAKRGTACRKCSRRELPLVIAEGDWGSTTVAATMFIAHAVGILVFATGGIGGVHRGGEVTMDVSADLDELAHTPVTVVCAGVKSILDISRTVSHTSALHSTQADKQSPTPEDTTERVTDRRGAALLMLQLEVLETRSVPVITLSTNPSHPFPAFFSPTSGCASPCVLSSTAAIAELVQTEERAGTGQRRARRSPQPQPGGR